MNKYIIQNDESGKQWAVGPVTMSKPCDSNSNYRILCEFEPEAAEQYYEDYEKHIASLPRYEWQGEKREVGDVVVENVDFWFGEGRVIKGRERAQVAIPLSKAEEGYYQEALHDAKYELPQRKTSKAEKVKEKEEITLELRVSILEEKVKHLENIHTVFK